MADNKVQITIQAIDKAKGELQGLQNNLKDVQTEGSKTGSVFSAMGKSFLVFTAAAGGITGVVAMLKSFINEAGEAEEIENRLRFALEAQGYAWGDLKHAVDEFAASVQASTRYSDEEARKALTDMLMYTRDFEKAQKASRLAMDMSVRTGMDLVSTSRYIGMAMSGNIDMLGRWIPELRDLDSKLGSNATQAEKAAYAMKTLQEKFGGTAQADMTTYAGKVQAFKNSWSDLQETLGRKLLPTLKDTFDWLKKVIDKADEFAQGKPSEKGPRVELAAIEKQISFYENFLKKAESGKAGVSYSLPTEAAADLRAKIEQLKEQKRQLKEMADVIDTLEGEDRLPVVSLRDLPPPADPKLLEKIREQEEKIREQGLESLGKYLDDEQALRDAAWTEISRQQVEEYATLKKLDDNYLSGLMENMGDFVDETDAHNLQIIQFKREEYELLKKLDDDYLSDLMANMGDFEEDATGHFRNIAEDNRRLAQESEKRWSDAAHVVSGAFEAGFFDLFKKGIEELDDVFMAFLNNLVESLFRAMAQMLTNLALFGNVGGAGQGSLGGIFGYFAANAKHDGGVGPGEGTLRLLPRLHGGLMPGEYAAVLRKDEGVFTPEQMKALGRNEVGVVINIENRTGARVTARETGTSFDGKRMIKSILLELAEEDMSVRQAYSIGG